MSSAAPALDGLKALTDIKARELYRDLGASGQLLPPELMTLPPEQLGRSLEALTTAITGHALAWGDMAREGSSLAHFSNGLIYAASMLGSFKQLDRRPLAVLSCVAIWAASMCRDVLTESGMSESEAGRLFDTLSEDIHAASGVLPHLPHDLARGALMAPLGVFFAASCAVSVSAESEQISAYLVTAGAMLAPPDFLPSGGEGLKA